MSATLPTPGPSASAVVPALEVRDLVVRYGRAPGRLRRRASAPAVDGVDLVLAPGRTVGLVGESGSGKSTIAKAVLGLQAVSDGTVTFRGQDLTSASARERRAVAADLRVVFQDPYSSLNPTRTIGDTLAEPLRLQGLGAAQARERAVEVLEQVGLPGEVVDRYPGQFSGGQRQRVAIARALVCRPEVVVLDEPVSALDLSTQAQVLNLLADLRDEHGYSFLFVAHDLGVVRFLSDDVVVLYRGRVMESGPAEEVTQRPRHPYTQALVAASPVPRPGEQAERRLARERLGVGSASTASADPAGCPFASRCPLATDTCSTERPALRLLGEAQVSCHHAS
ncbi:ABC transporter ATP-binding protein [Nocardioides bruguierae]|uniref:ABC transporter ATP-binding protein n=1 Tax=Nocardioides bruguierae TaxID=2945102 RepID=A0A9X2IFW7_9ACTN|nr:ABC transporter ATP-binding protein [Nocardioides bruguierae]MCM0621428.1 ABC transporter ATP-binding protein [Nocardioides bruguierae]